MKVTYRDAATGEVRVAHSVGSNGIQLPHGATILIVDPSTDASSRADSLPEWQSPSRESLEAGSPPDLDAVVSTLSFQPVSVPDRLLRVEAGGNARDVNRTSLVRYYDISNVGLLLLRESDNIAGAVERVATTPSNARVAGYDAFMRVACGPEGAACVSVSWSTPRIGYLMRLWSSDLERNALESKALGLATDLTNTLLR